MDTRFAVLPLDVVDTLVSHLPGERHNFLRLPHPRTGLPSLFLPHETVLGDGQKPISKILEVQAVEPPNARSWFNGDDVIADGKLLVMTPVDPLFLLIPILRAIKQLNGAAGNFRPAEDIFEDAARSMGEATVSCASEHKSPSVGVEDVMRFAALECTKKAMNRLCDVKEVSTEITVFRYSPEKLTQELRRKVATLSAPRITEMSRSLVRSLARDALMEDDNEDLLELGRTKLACEMLGQYLPSDIQQGLLASYDLSKLDAHIIALATEQSFENAALAKKSNTAAPLAPGGAKKRKNKGSQGVEKLKKANVSGMSKLSAFFTKKTD